MANNIIQEIEGIDDYWGPAFKSIYEGEGHDVFVGQLEARIKDHDKEIERMCHFYHQSFIDSIRDLLQVSSHAKALCEQTKELDAALHDATSNLFSHGDELVHSRKVERNIKAATDKLALFLPVMSTYTKLMNQVQAKKYYLALKTLEHLEHVLLPRISNYRFCVEISTNVPILRQMIRDESMKDLTDFLESIRHQTPKIGSIALQQTQKLLVRDLATIVQTSKNTKMTNGEKSEVDMCVPQDLVNFSPLYRCLHIHTVLGAKSDFIEYYRSQRKQQARLVLVPGTTMQETIQSYQTYLNSILGFFIVEDHLLTTSGGLVSRDWLLDLWGMAIGKVVSTLRINTSLVTDPQLMLNIKHHIVLFNMTLKCYGLTEELLRGLLQEMAEHYTEILMQRWVTIFREILNNEPFLPIEVESQAEYDEVLNNFPFNTEGLETQGFPKTFPFSSMVPAVYKQVKEFIYACLKFSTGLGLTPTQKAAQVRRSASFLLTCSFTGCLSSLFRQPSLALLQLVQIIIDTQYLESATAYLHQFIENITGVDDAPDHGLGAMFQVARDDAQQQICDKLKQKMNEFLELENYNWLLAESMGHASSFITDMITFLRNIFKSLTTLPNNVAVQACKAACEHMAKSMHQLIINPENKQISMGALNQINLDVIQCEQFAASEPVPGIKDGELLVYFAPLRQLLDLVMGWDWLNYLHDNGREGGRYPLVTAGDAAMLLEKIREADHRTSVFSVLKKTERDRKKLLDTVLKQLKQLPQPKE